MVYIGGQQVSTILKQVSVGSATLLWGVDAQQNIYQFTTSGTYTFGTGSGWTQTQITGKLVQVSVASDGTVWGINTAGSNIFHYTGGNNAWTQIGAGGLAQISVGSASNIWGVNAAGLIYKYNGKQVNDGTDWNQIPGALKQISVAADGTVCGVNASGNAYLYNGNNSWTALPGNNNNGQLSTYTGPWAQVISASAQSIWGLDPAGHLYTYQANNTAQPWSWMDYAPAISFSVASDGSVALIDSTGTTQFYATHLAL